MVKGTTYISAGVTVLVSGYKHFFYPGAAQFKHTVHQVVKPAYPLPQGNVGFLSL